MKNFFSKKSIIITGVIAFVIWIGSIVYANPSGTYCIFWDWPGCEKQQAEFFQKMDDLRNGYNADNEFLNSYVSNHMDDIQAKTNDAFKTSIGNIQTGINAKLQGSTERLTQLFAFREETKQELRRLSFQANLLHRPFVWALSTMKEPTLGQYIVLKLTYRNIIQWYSRLGSTIWISLLELNPEQIYPGTNYTDMVSSDI